MSNVHKIIRWEMIYYMLRRAVENIKVNKFILINLLIRDK